jgi:DNA-directed RNA polymerase subunit H (RpoH/RPB5)
MEDRALSTLKVMLTDRGVTAEKFETIGSTLDDAKLYTFAGVLIVFSTKARISERDLNSFIEYAKENNYSAGMIVVGLSKPSETVFQSLRNYISQKDVPAVHLFEIRHLQLQYAKHELLVPKHRIVDTAELADILKNENARDPSVFAKIDSQDAMARWVGARPGDVLEITGGCESSVENKHYRFCMADVVNG